MATGLQSPLTPDYDVLLGKGNLTPLDFAVEDFIPPIVPNVEGDTELAWDENFPLPSLSASSSVSHLQTSLLRAYLLQSANASRDASCVGSRVASRGASRRPSRRQSRAASPMPHASFDSTTLSNEAQPISLESQVNAGAHREGGRNAEVLRLNHLLSRIGSSSVVGGFNCKGADADAVAGEEKSEKERSEAIDEEEEEEEESASAHVAMEDLVTSSAVSEEASVAVVPKRRSLSTRVRGRANSKAEAGASRSESSPKVPTASNSTAGSRKAAGGSGKREKKRAGRRQPTSVQDVLQSLAKQPAVASAVASVSASSAAAAATAIAQAGPLPRAYTRKKDLTETELLIKRLSKLEKNRLSARECRMRKKNYISGLEGAMRKVQKENATLQKRVADVEHKNALLVEELKRLGHKPPARLSAGKTSSV